MRRSTTISASIVSLSVLALLVGAGQPRAQGPNDVTFSYSLESSKLVLHEPVIVNFVVDNHSTTRLQFDLGTGRKGSFLLSVIEPGGKKVSLPRFYQGGFSRLGLVSVDPGTQYAQRLLLDEWYKFDMEGKYEVELRLPEPVKSIDGRIVAEVPPFYATLQILPRNPSRLEETCAVLVRKIHAAPSYEAAAEATLTLSYVRDPVAVPYLEEALYSGRLVETIAIDGLRRISNQQAVQVLINALGSKAPQTSAKLQDMATAALGRIAFETHDAVLRETIRRALEHSKERQP